MNRAERKRSDLAAMLEFVRGTYVLLREPHPPPIPLCMYAVAACERPPTVGEAATLSGLPVKTVSRTLKELRTRKGVELAGDEHDERKRRALLTDEGVDVVALIHGALLEFTRNVHANGQPAVASQAPAKKSRRKK